MANGIRQGDTSSSGAAGLGDVVQVIRSLIKGQPRQPFDPLGVAKKTLKNQQELFALQQVINAQIAAGGAITTQQAQQQKTLLEQKERLERKFAKQQAKKPQKFIQAGIAAGTTLLELVKLLSLTSKGQKILSKFASPIFAPPPLESIKGGIKVPFTVTPSFQSQPGSLDFGGFGGIIESVIRAGGQIGSALLAPKAAPASFLQPVAERAGFGSFLTSPSVRTLIGGAAGGALGQGFIDMFQNPFGGASDLDDTAAFTDPIPGRCRPKEHLKVNPCSGKAVWFTPRGRPLVFSGDLAACKRVDRVSRRLNKALPLRKHGHRVTVSHRRAKR